MNNMRFIEKLLDGAEVDWKALGEVAKIQRGRRLVKSELEESGSYAVFQNSMTPLGYYHESNVQADTAFIISAGSAGAIGYSGVDFWAADDVYYFATPENLKSKFLYYFLLTQQTKITGQVRRSSVPRLSKTNFEKMPIPVPPLAVQAEIVRILDAFTELTAELTARKKQYNYYRDQLLSFEEGEVEWKALGEIGEFIRGKRFTKADYVDEGISVIHYGEIYTQYGVSTTHALSQVRAEMAASLRYAEPGDVVITDVGETVEDVGKAVAWIGNKKVAIHDHCYAFRHSMNPKFVSYCMKTASFIADKAKYVARTKVNTLLINGYSKISIPVPPIQEQARIVAILDKFDALTHSITEGLPREIELRQKQYEYYRDQLLSFERQAGGRQEREDAN